MNHMNFKLINISKSDLSINELTDKIKNITHYQDMRKYVMEKSENKIKQCTDYSMFPNII